MQCQRKMLGKNLAFNLSPAGIALPPRPEVPGCARGFCIPHSPHLTKDSCLSKGGRTGQAQGRGLCGLVYAPDGCECVCMCAYVHTYVSLCMCVWARVHLRVHMYACTCACARMYMCERQPPWEEALVIACMIQTISRRVEKMHMDGRLCEVSLYPFIEIILEHLLTPSTMLDLTLLKQRSKSFLRAKIQLTSVKSLLWGWEMNLYSCFLKCIPGFRWCSTKRIKNIFCGQTHLATTVLNRVTSF